jgi:hypothetical protein
MVRKLVEAINQRTLRKFGEQQGLDQLTLELAEVKEIADVLFKRLDSRIEAVKTVEASLDAKIRMLQALVSRAETLETKHPERDRLSEISTLGREGLGAEEIADRLELPIGEVELVLNLKGGKS